MKCLAIFFFLCNSFTLGKNSCSRVSWTPTNVWQDKCSWLPPGQINVHITYAFSPKKCPGVVEVEPLRLQHLFAMVENSFMHFKAPSIPCQRWPMKCVQVLKISWWFNRLPGRHLCATLIVPYIVAYAYEKSRKIKGECVAVGESFR